MTTILCQPQAFAVIASSEQATGPARNMNVDEPGMVWRSNGLLGVYVKVQLDGTPWDTMALVGSNLRAGDTIRIRAGGDAGAVDGTSGLSIDQTIAAWNGVAPTAGALSFAAFGGLVTSPFVRIDINSAGNPQGYVQASRLVLGKRVVTDGVSVNAEQTFEDMSSIEEGPGYTTVDEYGVRIGWKVTLDAIKDADYNGNWFPFLRAVGRKKAFVFIPDDSVPYVQTQAIFGRITSSAKGSSPVADYNNVELSLLSVS